MSAVGWQTITKDRPEQEFDIAFSTTLIVANFTNSFNDVNKVKKAVQFDGEFLKVFENRTTYYDAIL